MHDFHLADLIYRAILDYGQQSGLQKINKAVIELGSIVEHGEEVLPENLQFNIKMLAAGGPAENLEVVINKVEGGNWVLTEIEGD